MSYQLNHKKLLDPAVVAKLKTLELKAKTVVEGFMVGHHKSPYHGFSVEFSQHRPYMQGDSLKNLDWKVFAKSERYFIKQYEEETNLLAHVIIDTSKSMDYKHDASITKFEYSKNIELSKIHVSLNEDAVKSAIPLKRIFSKFAMPSKLAFLKFTKLSKIDHIKYAEFLNCASQKDIFARHRISQK